MGFRLRGVLVGCVLGLAGPLEAQYPTMAPAPAARFSISPEYAFALHTFSAPEGRTAHLFLARLEHRPTAPITAWVATGFYGCAACLGSGWVNFAGLRFDLAPEHWKAPVIPYGVAAAGLMLRDYRRGSLPSGQWVPSGGLGLRLRHSGELVPRVEVRYEVYDDTRYVILGLGVNVLISRRVPEAGG